MNECYNCGFEEDFRDHGFLEEVNNNEQDRTP